MDSSCINGSTLIFLYKSIDGYVNEEILLENLIQSLELKGEWDAKSSTELSNLI